MEDYIDKKFKDSPKENQDNYEMNELYRNGKLMFARVANKFIRTKDGFVITERKTDNIFYFEKKFWCNGGDKEIKFYCKDLLEDNYSKHLGAEIVAHVKAGTYLVDTFPEPKLNHIPLENGVYDLDTDELIDYKHNFYFRKESILSVKYDKEATCPAIHKFLGEIVKGKENVDILYEFIGYCLYRNYPIAKILMLVGSGANGKSTLVKLIKTFLGPENISGRTMQEIDGNRFAAANLKGKLANIMADLPAKQLKVTSMFKTLTGGDFVTVEAKYGKDPMNFVNTAKLIFCANQLPITDDKSDAFFRRFIFIDFPNTFQGENDDTKLIYKLTTPEELSGLLNKAIEGLKRVLEKEKFSFSKNTEEIRTWYKRQSDPVDYFLSENVDFEFNSFLTTEQLYDKYLSFCGRHGMVYDSEPIFAKKMKYLIGDNIRPSQRTMENGDRKKGYEGICWKKDNIKIIGL